MKNKNAIMVLIRTILQKKKWQSAGLLAVIIGSIIAALVPPLVLKEIVNGLTAGSGVPFATAVLYFAALAFSGLLDAGKEGMITVFGQRVTRALRHEMCSKLSALPASYYTRWEAGKTTSRFVNDVDTVESLFTNGIISMAADICKVVSIIFMIFFMSKGLGIMMVLITPLLFGMTRLFQRRMLKAQLENRAAIARVNNHVPETVQNIRMIHTFGKERYMEQRYDEYIQESYQAVEKSNFYDAIYSPIILVVSALIIAIMMSLSAMGGTMQSFFGMSVGTAVAIIAYVGKVFDPLESIGMEIESIQSAVAGVKRINEFLEETERKETDAKITCKDLLSKAEGKEACIQFTHVDFGYDKDNLVLKDQEIRIKEGENVTLAGRTGAGKSTAFKLILGMYPPARGTVAIYGVPADQIPDQEKRALFGYVEQSFFFVPGTVEDQIALYDPDITREEVENAAKLTGIHESIAALPEGYDTKCKESLFSQGQMQLLAIARAIVKNPAIMLLDEITANLDTDTEKKVLAAIEKAAKNRTVVSISHRIYEQMEQGRLLYIE